MKMGKGNLIHSALSFFGRDRFEWVTVGHYQSALLEKMI